MEKWVKSQAATHLTFDDIVQGKQITDEVHLPVDLKPKEQYLLVGKAISRADIG